MAEVVHAVAAIDSAVNMNSTSFATRLTISSSDLSTAGFSTGEDVIVLFWAILSQANLATEQVWQLTYNGSAITNGTASPRLDCPSFANTGQNVGWMARVNLGGSLGDFDFDNQRQGTSANVTVQKARMVIIRCADLGTENVDWFWNESTTNVAHTTTYSGTNRASITWTPASSTEDWVAFAATHIAIDSTSVNAEARLLLDGTTLVAGDWSIEGESNNEELASWMFGVMENLATSSHTITVETRDDGTAANDHRQSNILLLRAGRFPDMFWHVNSNVSTSPDTRTQVATVTSSLSGNQDALIAVNLHHDIVATENDCWVDVEIADSTITPNTAPNGTFDNFTLCAGIARDGTDELNVMWMDVEALSSGAQNIDANASATDNTTAIEPRLLVWGFLLASSATPATATPGAISAALALPAGSAKGAAKTTPAVTVGALTVPAASVQGVGKTLPSVVSAGLAVPAVSARGGSVTAPSVVDAALTVPSVTAFDSGAAGAAAPAVTATSATIPAVTVSGAASVSPSALTVSLTIPAVSLTYGTVSTPAVLDVTLTLPQVSVIGSGAATVTPDQIAAALALPQATPVSTASVSLSMLAAVLAMPAAMTAGAAKTALSVLNVSLSLYGPTPTAAASTTPSPVALVLALPDVQVFGPAQVDGGLHLIVVLPAAIGLDATEAITYQEGGLTVTVLSGSLAAAAQSGGLTVSSQSSGLEVAQ